MQKKEQFEELFKNNYKQMLRLSMLIIKDEEESKDIVSDIFTEIWDGTINPYVDKSRNYLLMCVRNRCLDLLNHKRIKERVCRLLTIESSLPSIAINNDTSRYAETQRDGRYPFNAQRQASTYYEI